MACLDQNMAGAGDSGCGAAHGFQIDEAYEFSAPRFFDFMNGETREEIRKAELWFENTQSYAPSPFMMRIRGARFAQANGICCDFGDVEKTTDLGPQEASSGNDGLKPPVEDTSQVVEIADGRGTETTAEQEMNGVNNPSERTTKLEPSGDGSGSLSVTNCIAETAEKPCHLMASALPASSRVPTVQGHEACTPKVPRVSAKGAAPSSSKNPAAKKNITMVQKSSPKPRDHLLSQQSTKSTKTKSVPRCNGNFVAKSTTATDVAQENQAIKRQRLDGGKTRQIHDVKNRVLPHKSKPDLTSSMDKTHHEEAMPFVSVAELVKRFETKTREVDFSQNHSLSHEDTASIIQRRPKLTLTRPKEPEFETAHRVRAVRIKSSAELEEEMLAKIPKFKARPVNKKILESPALPALPKSTPQTPRFQEFHLKTMERAKQHSATPSVSSFSESACQNQCKIPKLTEPRPPRLETSLRARPPRVKTSQELELEELEKIPKFKARPLNKRIFESKGDLGLFSNPKRQLTIPQEFHFATNERLGPPPSVVDLFDKLSLYSESSENAEKNVSRLTIPNPFNLQTEERGLEKERKFAEQLLMKQLEEEKARVQKANPYPYTTDYPVIPPKPEPKSCTKPEAFQLESLVRHEEELHKKMEEKERMEKEEGQRRIFRAKPIMKDSDPIPLPDKERKPLTEVQEFALHVDHRAQDRAEFDKKIKEKEMVYKRQREENEHAKMIEEEKALKQMRRTMVPHARPLPRFDNPFHPQKNVKETTKPKSPMLLVAKREERRRQYMR